MTPRFPAQPELAGHPYFQFRNNVLYAEDVPLDHLAEKLGTPLYVYSRAALKAAWESYRNAVGQHPVLVCYGMKANSNLAVLKEFARLGAGFDIVSGGELKRALAAGADPSRIVFSGVGKQAWEMRAALAAKVKCFNVESEAELRLLSTIAHGMGLRAPVSLRVNPDVDAQTHPYISTGLKENKFGIAIESALDVYRLAQSLPALEIVGVDCHIGSQLTDISPYFDALEKLLDLIEKLDQAGIRIAHLDLGGGLGIRYTDEIPPSPQALLDRVFERLNARGFGHLHLVLEPGRSLVGNAGVLLTRVQYLKHSEARNFAIVDAAMNDLLRPALYEAFHGVRPVHPRAGDETLYDIVGPVCESADWLARQRKLAIQQGDLLAVESAGAYSMAMASNYNARPRAAEAMVDGDKYYVVRQRETLEDLLKGESTLP
ncbi:MULTISPECIES: diaminopimelate decarboxylase [Achromobacter]|uniref:Diaminopimelate decarboxylase n=1 Tax=Alcaligenes xylosoxydans xylosoxydans TaxID=85698 RepID=A0A424WBE3_ALCXX|nr:MULTISPECIES: diaminopimelate decarboxylase [Achromobacter]MBC9907124.1 diaminopimelate decarboxylase [Achromobacter xylosoxidans]MBD0870329.1 diaminopimelate decarboxylase [Achromobacter xylosoxidans]QNP85807.1 diaminopimelate decarboxylase [Achromobacter xylosoxidans]RPJ90510.1 diaminopimelate decarboxylase [Achromobacter xylosoxidans]WLW61692.1 diaminopimelate decarboxylase [Achromobacter aegrifaciens]